MLKYASLALVALLAVPAAAQTPAPPAQSGASQTAEKPKNPLDKVVCRTEDTMGTRLGGHRVCATVREWQDQAQENRDAIDKIQQGQGTVPSG